MVESSVTQSDCLEYLSTLDDNSVDLVVTDPPYFIGFDGGKGWDSQWDSEHAYLEWCEQWTNECVRVLKQSYVYCMGYTQDRNIPEIQITDTDNHAVLTPQNEIIWGYNWGGRSKTNFARKHEYAWCWSKGKDFLFNDKEIRVERKLKKNIRTGKDYTEGTIPTCIWKRIITLHQKIIVVGILLPRIWK